MLEFLATQDRAVLQALLAWIICLAALVWGSAPERAVALTWLVCIEILARFYYWNVAEPYRFADIDLVVTAIDVTAGLAWLAIALYANRNYPLWIAAFQLMSVAAHLARGLAETISAIAYAAMVVTPSWFQLAFLAGGLTRHILRKRRYGTYRDWRVVRSPLGGADTKISTNSTGDWLAHDVTTWRDDLK